MTENKTINLVGELIGRKSLSGIVKALCGQQLGFGCYRDVYELKQNSQYVVKIQRDASDGMFANVTEWRNWINNERWDFLSNYLAPCLLITNNGRVLIQKRVTFKSKELYPQYVPVMFTDLKISNFGWIKDKFVCCDYAYIPLAFVQKGKSKMQQVKWID